MEEPTHFTDEESGLPDTQGIHGQAETRIEMFRLPATGRPLCVCAVWSSKRSSSSFNLLLSVSQKANVEETGSPLSQSPVTSHGGLMR